MIVALALEGLNKNPEFQNQNISLYYTMVFLYL